MGNDLKKIRITNKSLKIKNKIINTFLIFLFGVILGIFSKWLDNLSIDDFCVVATYIRNIGSWKCVFYVWNMAIYWYNNICF